MSRRRSTAELLEEALAHLRLAGGYADAGPDDQRNRDAISMRLAAGIESLSRLDEETRNRLFGEDWRTMWGLRNRIAHGYVLVDARILDATVERDLPHLLATLDSALRMTGETEDSDTNER